MYLFFTVDERALQLYQKRRKADQTPDKLSVAFQFALDTDDGFPREATLNFADVKVDPGTGTITVRGTVANGNRELVAGSRTRVRIAVSEPRQAALVPDRAIMADQDRRYVYVVDGKNVVERRDVRPGKLLDDGMREVTPRDQKAPPFTAADRIIVSGLLRARIGQPVDPGSAK
jgi:multidrug efflux system membrane fusion protein